VEEFDHHCPWLSNCIGKRNYRYFLIFIMVSSALSVLTTAMMLILFDRLRAASGLEFIDASVKHWPELAVALISVLAGLYTLMLLIYHCTIVGRDLTTSEQIKQSRSRHDLLNSNAAQGQAKRKGKGWFSNMYRIMCGPRHPRMVAWHHYKSGPPPNNFSEDFV